MVPCHRRGRGGVELVIAERAAQLAKAEAHEAASQRGEVVLLAPDAPHVLCATGVHLDGFDAHAKVVGFVATAEEVASVPDLVVEAPLAAQARGNKCKNAVAKASDTSPKPITKKVRLRARKAGDLTVKLKLNRIEKGLLAAASAGGQGVDVSVPGSVRQKRQPKELLNVLVRVVKSAGS
jgi:hypothetical protein